MDVCDIVSIFDSVEAQFVRVAMDKAAFHTGTREPYRETVWMMIKAGVFFVVAADFYSRRVSKLSAEHDECVIKHSECHSFIKSPSAFEAKCTVPDRPSDTEIF